MYYTFVIDATDPCVCQGEEELVVGEHLHDSTSLVEGIGGEEVSHLFIKGVVLILFMLWLSSSIQSHGTTQSCIDRSLGLRGRSEGLLRA